MDLFIVESGPDYVTAGYQCSCGCQPTTSYRRGGPVGTDVCCCGNQFAVGPDAERHVAAQDGFRLETGSLAVPWGDAVAAAWMIGSGQHPPASDSGHDQGHAGHGHDHDRHAQAADGHPLPVVDGSVVDPVCGMSVQPAAALEKGLHSQYRGVDYFFCGKGCKLEFDDDPEHFLDPEYVPSM